MVATFTKIETAFNIETVTDEFFEKYKELFLKLEEYFNKEFVHCPKLKQDLSRPWY